MSDRAEPSSSEIDRFRLTVQRRLGLRFDDGKLGFLAQVLRRRADERRQAIPLYLAQLDGSVSREELRPLARELTVAETFFFRNIEQFRALEKVVFPARAQVRGPRGLRILSAGCASGDEAYTLAIVANESAQTADCEISIRGIEINPAMLDRAAKGRYTSWALRETPPEMRGRYFQEAGREFCLDARIRTMVTFEERNLVDDDPAFWQPEVFDVVFCRNVLMYFAPETARSVLARLTRSLAPGGYLFLGYAETLRGLSQDFHLRHTHGTFYYQRREGGGQSSVDGAWDGPPLSPDLPPMAVPDDSWVETILRASERVRSLTEPADEVRRPGASEVEPQNGRNASSQDLRIVTDLMRQERFVEARTSLASFPAESARDPDVLLLRAVLSTHGGDLAAAERLCEDVLHLDGLSAGAHYLTALCREGVGDRQGAADHDQVAAHLDPFFAMPRLHLGLLARRAGDDDAASRELNEAIGLLAREDPARILLFGGGFSRESLVALCRAELLTCGAPP